MAIQVKRQVYYGDPPHNKYEVPELISPALLKGHLVSKCAVFLFEVRRAQVLIALASHPERKDRHQGCQENRIATNSIWSDFTTSHVRDGGLRQASRIAPGRWVVLPVKNSSDNYLQVTIKVQLKDLRENHGGDQFVEEAVAKFKLLTQKPHRG